MIKKIVTFYIFSFFFWQSIIFQTFSCGLLKLKTVLESSNLKIGKDGDADKPLYKLLKQNCGALLQPFLLGLDTKSPGIMASSFMSIQRMLSHSVIDHSSANMIMASLLAISENERSVGGLFGYSVASYIKKWLKIERIITKWQFFSQN